MTITFKDKVAIVTGAGGGIGRCHALELARLGAKVVVNDYGGSADGQGASSTPAQRVVDEIVAAGGEAIANAASVSTPDGANSIAEDAIKHWGRIDILINNAGILRDKSFAKASLDDFRAIFDVHFWGTVYCTKAVWPHMVAQNYGRIVNTTSTSGLFGNFGQANYGSAKMAVVGLMNSLKIEGKKYNIAVNAIAPVAATRLTEALMPPEMSKSLPPSTVTPAVLYLCSDEAPTGIILQAAGGNYQRIAIVETAGKFLGTDATVDDIAAHFSEIGDLSQLKTKETAA